MFTWLCISTGIGGWIGNSWDNSIWLGSFIGLLFGILSWIVIRLGSGDSVSELFDSIGDMGDSFGGSDFGGDGGGSGD